MVRRLPLAVKFSLRVTNKRDSVRYPFCFWHKSGQKKHNIIMAKIDKSFLIKLTLVALTAFLIFNYTIAMGLIRVVLKAVRPILIGLIIALVLNLPLNLFEKKLFAKIESHKLRKALALVCTIAIVALFFAAIIFLIVPQIIAGSANLAQSIREFAEKNYDRSNQIIKWLITNLQEYISDISKTFKDLMPQIMSYTGRFVKGLVDVFLGIFLAFLMLATKDNLLGQLQKFLNYKFEKGKAARFIAALNLAVKKFSRYLGGQVVEAIIFGVAIYIGMVILRIPYAPLIAVIMGFVNLIPMIGGYIGAIISVILIFAANPVKALVFLIFSTVLQQIEGVTTYPVIVGKNVGLNAFWILSSVIVGGALFGFAGVFLGVPAVAFIHDYIGQLIRLEKEENERLQREQEMKEGSDKDLTEVIKDNKQFMEKKVYITDKEEG